MVNINVTRCSERNIPTAVAFVTATGTTAGKGESYAFRFDGADERAYIIVANGESKNIVIKLSDSDNCTAVSNKEHTITAGVTAVIPLETGRCIKNDGSIVLTVTPESSSDTLSACNVGIAGFVGGYPTN